MSIIEDQRTPRELDDYEFEQAYGTPGETCDICGDGVYRPRAITINDERCCSGDCAAVVLREVMADELAARAVPEAVDEDETTPLPFEPMAAVVEGRLR